MTIFTNQSELSLLEAKTKVLTLLTENEFPVSLGQIHRATKIEYIDLYVVLKQLMDASAVLEEFIGAKTCYSLVRKTEL